MMRRLLLSCVLVVPLLAFLASPAVAETLEATGTFVQGSFVVTEARTVGTVTFISFEETANLTGTLTGGASITGRCAAFASGQVLCTADGLFTGTAAGASGTLRFKDVNRINLNTGSFHGHTVIVGGTGHLTNIHGHLTAVGTGTTGTYSGTLAIGP